MELPHHSKGILEVPHMVDILEMHNLSKDIQVAPLINPDTQELQERHRLMDGESIKLKKIIGPKLVLSMIFNLVTSKK